MFGKYEDYSKIIPYLILAQKNKSIINLSSGLQKRDFLFVEDFVKFLIEIIKIKTFVDLPNCINVGEGTSISIRDLASKLSALLPTYEAKYWNWNAVPQRIGEQDDFFNNSNLCKTLGYKSTDFEENLTCTINYYWNL
jgi:nucleoside-diphosphate-sugar epimerase